MRAAQLVYGNVEAEESPHGRRGYQTLLHSRDGISDAEVREIEARLFYVPKETPPAPKRVFFTTGTGKIVLALVRPLEATDQFGRAGLTFGHALVLRPAAFQEAENHPFAVFDASPFLGSPKEALAAGDPGRAHLPLVEVVPMPPGGEAPRVDPETLLGLILLASRAPQLREERRALACYGHPEVMAALLRDLFPLIPPQLRPGCSFDTAFAEGSLSRLPCWAVGLPGGEVRRRGLIGFELEQGAFVERPPSPSETAFERWLAQAARGRDVARLAAESGAACTLGALFDGSLPDCSALRAVSDGVFADLLSQSGDRLESRARGELVLRLGETFAGRIWPVAREWALQDRPHLEQYLGRGYPPSEVTRWVLALFPGRPKPAEMDELARQVKQGADPALQAVYLRWTYRWEALGRLLGQMDDDSFRAFAAWAVRTIPLDPAWSIMRDEQGLALAGVYAPASGESEEAAALLLTLLGHPDATLAPRPDLASPASRGLLGKFLKKPEKPAPPPAPLRPTGQPERWQCIMELLNASGRGG